MRHVTFALVVAFGVVAPSAPLSAIEPEETGILNATSPEPGILFGGQPTAEQLEKLAAAEYKTVIDLRAPSEDRGYDEAAAAKAAGLDYVPIPVTEETLQDAEDARSVHRGLQRDREAGAGALRKRHPRRAVYYAWLVSEKKMSREEALAKAKEEGLRRETYIPPSTLPGPEEERRGR